MFLVGRRTQKHLLEINTSPFATVGSDNSSRKTKKTQKTENQEVKDHWEFFTHGRIILKRCFWHLILIIYTFTVTELYLR